MIVHRLNLTIHFITNYNLLKLKIINPKPFILLLWYILNSTLVLYIFLKKYFNW